MIPPRAVLTTRMPGLARARRSAPMQPGGFRRLRQVDGEEVGLGDHPFEGQQLRAQLPGSLGADVGVVGQQPHPEGGGPLGDQRADPAQPDHAEHLAVQLDPLPAGALPPAGDQGGVGLRDVAGLGQQEGHGVLGGGEDVGLRGVDDHHPAAGGGGHVDVVEPDAGPADHHQVGRGLEQGARSPGWPSG